MNSRKRYRGDLGSFLLGKLEDGSIPGLDWIRREEKLFKLPWYDNRRKNDSASEKHVIFKEWEKHKSRYKDGEEERWSDWKQTFRGAMYKSSAVSYVENLSDLKHPSAPFAAYKFTDVITLPESAKRKRVKNTSSHLFQNVIEFSPNREAVDEIHNNIPEVVFDKLNLPFSVDEQQNNMENPCLFSNNLCLCSDEEEMICFFNSVPRSNYSCSLPSFGETPLVKYQVFYGNCPVLQGTINSIGSRFFYDKPITDSHQMSTKDSYRIYGPRDCDQVELPNVKSCDNVCKKYPSKVIERIQTILDGMNRGLILYCEDRKLFAIRRCSVGVSAWNQNNGNNVASLLERKASQQLFDMRDFENNIHALKENSECNACLFSPSVTLIIGHEFKMEYLLKGTMKVHIELTYLEAEAQMAEIDDCDQEILFSRLDSDDIFIKDFKQKISFAA